MQVQLKTLPQIRGPQDNPQKKPPHSGPAAINRIGVGWAGGKTFFTVGAQGQVPLISLGRAGSIGVLAGPVVSRSLGNSERVSSESAQGQYALFAAVPAPPSPSAGPSETSQVELRTPGYVALELGGLYVESPVMAKKRLQFRASLSPEYVSLDMRPHSVEIYRTERLEKNGSSSLVGYHEQEVGIGTGTHKSGLNAKLRLGASYRSSDKLSFGVEGALGVGTLTNGSVSVFGKIGL